MAKKLTPRKRMPGVVAKMQRLKTTVPTIVQYILDLLKQQQKLYCPPWLQRLNLPEPAAGNKGRPANLGRHLSFQVEKAIEWLQGNRCAVAEITVSLPPGEGWSPKQWRFFWRRFLYHLGSVTYVRDHCVPRKPVIGPDGKQLMGPKGKPRWERARKSKFFNVNLAQYMCVVPIHDNSGSQHLQALLVLRDLVFRQVAVINHGYYQLAVQWAARRAEEDLGLVKDPRMPDFDKLTDQLGYDRIVDPALIARVGRSFKFIKKREPSPDRIPERSTKSLIMRDQPPAILKMLKILHDRTPDDFAELNDLREFLKANEACILRPPKGVGLLFCVAGSHTRPFLVADDWSNPRLLKRWPELAKPRVLVGMSPKRQTILLAKAKKSRFIAAGLSFARPAKAELTDIITIASAVIETLPWDRIWINEQCLDGTTRRLGEFTKEGLAERIKIMFQVAKPVLDRTLHFRPASADILSVPLRGLTQANAKRLAVHHKLALLSETQPGLYDALILVAPFGGEPWENKRALRRLTHRLAKIYKAVDGIVADDGIPLPGLPQLSGTGHRVNLLGQARDGVCPKTSRLLARFGKGLAAREHLWWQGAPGWVLRQLEIKNLRPHFIPPSYLDALRVFAANPMRCETLEEMNLRIATRMLAQRHGDKIMTVFETIKKQWPGIVTDEPLAIFEQCGKYPINYLRSPDEFRPPRKPEVNLPSVAKAPEFTPSLTVPPQRIQPSQRIPMGPIAPDYVYDATPDIGDQLNAHIEHIAIATFTVFKSICKRLMNPELAPTGGELREHAKQCLECFIGINEQLRREQLEALEASMTVSKRETSISPQPNAPALGQTKLLTPNQARHAPEQKPDPDDRSREVDPQIQNTPAPDPALTVDNEASLRRNKEAAAERRRNLEALAFTEQDTDLLRNHLATNPKTSVGAAIITRMVWSLADYGDQSRLNELLDWLTDNCTQVPGWFDTEFEFHQNALAKEEAEMKNEAEEMTRTNSGPEGLVR